MVLLVLSSKTIYFETSDTWLKNLESVIFFYAHKSQVFQDMEMTVSCVDDL